MKKLIKLIYLIFTAFLFACKNLTYEDRNLVENIKTGEVWVIDSKQIAKSKTFEAGAMQVIENAADNKRQLSKEWIETVANKLSEKEEKF